MNNNPVPQNINISELVKRGEDIYQQDLKQILEPEHNGKYVAIEPDSGQHFIGETKEEAVSKAKQEFPNKLFVVRRIGEIEKISSYSYSQYYNDWLL